MHQGKKPNLAIATLAAACAGGMGWGIRGQYGHQTGAMIAGLLVGFVIVLFFAPRFRSLSAARIVAFLTLGVSLGGSMTYGQTLGLTQDAPLVGNWEALRWGLLGVFIKGGVWIGLAGLFLGIALSGKSYPATELGLLLLAAVLFRFVGIEVFNEPFAPGELRLPIIYFSDHWYWEPDIELKPRREVWGGLWLALLAMMAYVRGIRGDRLAFRIAIWGIIAGGTGFTLGQCIQASHAWMPEWYQQSWISGLVPFLNWWNLMEISFGTVFGAILCVGVWFNHALITEKETTPPELSWPQESLTLLMHISAIIAWSFFSFASFDFWADMAFTMILIPMLSVAAGRIWPYFFIFPTVLIPIAGKTLRQASFNTDYFPMATGWLVLLILPLAVSIAIAIFFAKSASKHNATTFARWGLLAVTWQLFSLNLVFFELPWPWQAWTGRTPSAIIFTLCVCVLTCVCMATNRTSTQIATSQN